MFDFEALCYVHISRVSTIQMEEKTLNADMRVIICVLYSAYIVVYSQITAKRLTSGDEL